MNNSFRYFYFILISFLILSKASVAQEINYVAGFNGILDNREYFTNYSPHYTIFGSLFNTGANLKYNEHNLNFGLNYFYEFGDLEKNRKPDFYANYHYCDDDDNFYFGVFKRENLINFHRGLLNDTLLYSRPYAEGIFYGKKFNNISEQIWIDWTSLQTENIRETFLVGQEGFIDLAPFFINHQFLMLHYSLPKIQADDDHIRDNIGLVFQVGQKTEAFLFLDSMSYSVGVMLGMDRLRGVYDWETPLGGLLETSMHYKRFTFDGLIYLGGKQDMFYGDKFYQAGKYSRWDLSISLFNKKNINGEFEFTFHIVDKTIDFAQALRVWMDLDYRVFNAKN